jgi:hypothetical protein
MPDRTDVEVRLQQLETVNIRRPSAEHDTVQSELPSLSFVPDLDRTVETSTEIQLPPQEVDDGSRRELELPPRSPAELGFWDTGTELLAPADSFDEELSTGRWGKPQEQDGRLLAALADTAGNALYPQYYRPEPPIPGWRRMAVIGGSCFVVLALAVALYSIVVAW